MRDLLDALDRWRAEGQPIALATLVQVHGSAPRLPGARMVITGDGRMAGSVSGGCVESDILTRAARVLAEGTPAFVHYGIADDSELAVGLTCAEIEVLIEPWHETPAWMAIRESLAAHTPAVLAVAVAPDALAGKSLAVGPDDVCRGAIDPALDADVRRAAGAMRGAAAVRLLTFGNGPDAPIVFLEAFVRPERLIVSGGSHTAVALVRMAKLLGMHVTVIDARSAYLGRERFPDADALVHAPPGRALADLDLADAAVVTLTHDLKYDVPALAAALRGGAAYVGAMGSLATHARRRAALVEAGVDVRAIAQIRTPVGLDIGSRTPEEIALAILAEVIAAREGRDARPLRAHGIVHEDGRVRRAEGAR